MEKGENKLNERMASIIELADKQNYECFSKKHNRNCITMLNNYLQKVIAYRLKNYDFVKEQVILLGKHMIEHLTGNYEIGLSAESFEEQKEKAETLTNIIAYSDKDTLEKGLKTHKEKELAQIVVDGSIASGIINCSENRDIQMKAEHNFEKSDGKMKDFFRKAFDNIIHFNRTVANGVAHVTGMDREESMELNHNIAGKMVGGIAYELLSGTLISKRHFTSVQNSKSMKETIQNEGILHFSSLSTIEKIMGDGKIKKSNVFTSDLTAPKSFFFAGVPQFEDLLINIPAYDVMTAVRIRPNQEQMEELKYRAINDRAVVKDGDFEFDKKQAEIAYFGLMYDEQKDSLYLGELSKEEAEHFKVSEKVKQNYHYNSGKNNLVDSIKMNAYGFYAEYRHHQKLLQMEQQLKQRGFKNGFRNVDDEILVEMANIEEAHITSKRSKGTGPARIKIIENLLTTIRNMFQKVIQPKINENPDEKIDRILGEFTFDKKNPYRDKKFRSAVLDFESHGLTQLDLKTELKDLIQSEEGHFFRNRVTSLDKQPIRKRGIHGIRT